MTQREWKRRRDAQRLMNWNRAALADEVDAAPVPPLAVSQIIAIDEASELTPDVLKMFAKTMQEITERNLQPMVSSMIDGGMFRLSVDPAGEPEGRQVTALEIRNRRPRLGLYFGRQNENSAPPMNVRNDGPIYFNRWMDMSDSEDELQRFLWECWKFGDKFRTEGEMSVKDLEGDE